MAETKGETSSPIAEISHGPSAFEQFLDKNQKLLILIAILSALGTAAWVVQRGVSEGVEKAAGAALVDADDAAALEDMIEEHDGTAAAVSAGLLLADRQWEDGQQDAALATLNGLISQHADHPAAGPARARLGSRLAQQGKYDEAKPVLQALAQTSGEDYLAPYALITLAQIAKAEGDLEQAEQFLEQSANYPNNFFSQAANNQRRFLRFEMPEEVDPPELPEVGDPAAPGAPGQPQGTSPPFQLQDSEADAGAVPSGNPLIDVLGGSGDEPAVDEVPAGADPAESDAPAGPADEGDESTDESDESTDDSGD